MLGRWTWQMRQADGVGLGAAVTDDERTELNAVLADLRDEETEQQAERGHASQRVLRAAARLELLLAGRTTEESV